VNADGRSRPLDRGFDAAAIDARLDQVIRVRIAPERAGWARQLLAVCLVDLLGRLSPCMVLDCDPDLPAHEALPPGPETLLGRLEEARLHTMVESRQSDEEPVISIAVGGGREADLYADGWGWVSFLGTDQPAELDTGPGNPIGPLLAACRAAAAVSKMLLDDLVHSAPLPAASYWGAATLEEASAESALAGPDLSRLRLDALLMGAGSIGGAAVYALARIPELLGSFILLDPDKLKDRNSRKALLARRADITSQARKVDVAAAEFGHHEELDTPTFDETLGCWVASRSADQPLPLTLCAVDSVDARRELADHMPLDVVNAACGSRHLTVSGHRTDDGPCVYCLYLPDRLDAEQTRRRMIVRETGFEPGYVDQLRNQKAQLSPLHLRQVEDHLHRPRGSLPRSPRMTLDELFDRHLLYAEAQVTDEQGRRGALTLPFAPALAGVLLAAEAIKRSLGPPWLDLALGPRSGSTEYSEDLFDGPGGIRASYPRIEGSACLCRSRHRLQLMRDRYQLP
jgi:hypothetical protein